MPDVSSSVQKTLCDTSVEKKVCREKGSGEEGE